MTLSSVPTATLGSANLHFEQFCTHWTGWNKPHGDVMYCRLEIPLNYVLERFSGYWTELIARESEDDGTVQPVGPYADLAAHGYPSLQIMLTTHSRLFSSLIMDGLQADFTGYILQTPSELGDSEPCYFLHCLSSMDVINELVVVSGSCYLFRKP